jgi:hypothetical protein
MIGIQLADRVVGADWVHDAETLITPLYNLATDCFRLSMHFFHPIQQCAQQVYHTALPLSPTSSELRKSYLRSGAGDQLSRIATFSGAPDSWGLLLRTINVRPRRLTCIATSTQRIIAACGDIVYIYDAVTFVLRQSLHTPEAVTKIQGSRDESTLLFAHSRSVTMWDEQTGGLTHTFTTRSKINDIAISTTEDYIAYGTADGSVAFWKLHTKEEGECFGNGQPVVAVCWLGPWELAVATQSSVYIRDITTHNIQEIFSIYGHVWGMVYAASKRSFVVGVSQPGEGAGQELSAFFTVKYSFNVWLPGPTLRSAMYPGRLLRPTPVDDEIVCIAPPSGVQLFDTVSGIWANNPPLLGAATSVALSLDGNLVAQTKDSIQVFSLDVLMSGGASDSIRGSHVYPLGENHIVCLLQPTRHLTILELGTLRELRPNDNTSALRSLFKKLSPSTRASFSRGFVPELGASVVIQAWRSGAPLPEWTRVVDEDAPLSGLSPKCTRIVTVYGSPRWELRVKDVKDGTVIAKLPLERDGLGVGKVYDITFDSETKFYLKVDGRGRHVQIPHYITTLPSGLYSHKITKGRPVPLSEPRAMPPYTLDANCEWVVDAESRKICWISPGNVRRGDGGHFWAGLELVMVGDDGVVRKVSFKDPDS